MTTLTVPFYILKDGKSDAGQNLRIVGAAFLVYAMLAVIIALRIGSIAEFMQATDSANYYVAHSVLLCLYRMLRVGCMVRFLRQNVVYDDDFAYCEYRILWACISIRVFSD